MLHVCNYITERTTFGVIVVGRGFKSTCKLPPVLLDHILSFCITWRHQKLQLRVDVESPMLSTNLHTVASPCKS